MIEKCEFMTRSHSRVGVICGPTVREQPRCIDALKFMNCSVGVAGWKANFRFALRVDDFHEISNSRFRENQTQMGAINIELVVVVSLAIRSGPCTL